MSKDEEGIYKLTPALYLHLMSVVVDALASVAFECDAVALLIVEADCAVWSLNGHRHRCGRLVADIVSELRLTVRASPDIQLALLMRL